MTWSCLGFLFALVSTSTSLAWSLTASSHSKTMCVVLFFVSLRELVFWGWWNVYLWTPLLLCLMLPILEYCSPVWGQLLIVTFSFSSSRCIREPWSEFLVVMSSNPTISFLSLWIMLLVYVRCTSLIRTRITVCSARFRLLLSEFRVWSINV